MAARKRRPKAARPPGRPPLAGPGIGARLRDLRLLFGWSQETFAQRSGLQRTEVTTVENGRNKGSSWRIRALLAKGFGVPEEALNAYWDGRTSLHEIASQIEAGGAAKRVQPQAGGDASEQRGILRFPNLELAVDAVCRYKDQDPKIVRRAALEVARAHGGGADQDLFQWARLLEAQLGLLDSGKRPNPRSVRNLASAMELLGQDRPENAEAVEELARRVLERAEAPAALSIVQWILLMHQEREAPGSGTEPERAAAQKGRPRRRS